MPELIQATYDAAAVGTASYRSSEQRLAPLYPGGSGVNGDAHTVLHLRASEKTYLGFLPVAAKLTLKIDNARGLSICFAESTLGCRTQGSDLVWRAPIHQHPEARPTPPSIFKHIDQSLVTTGATQCWVKTSHNVTVTAFPWEPSHVHIQEVPSSWEDRQGMARLQAPTAQTVCPIAGINSTMVKQHIDSLCQT